MCTLLALAQVIAFSHVALVAHRICAEHGEAIHMPGAAYAPAAPAGAFASVLPSRSAAVAHDHEHCLCMAYGRERLVLPTPTSDGVEQVAAACPWPVSSRPSHALPGALFLLAPKGSPPASL